MFGFLDGGAHGYLSQCADRLPASRRSTYEKEKHERGLTKTDLLRIGRQIFGQNLREMSEIFENEHVNMRKCSTKFS